MMFLLIIPATLNYFFAIVGIAAFIGLFILLYKLIFGPVLKAGMERQSPPPEENAVMEILIDDIVRSRRISIGQLDSDIKIRMNGIKEDHLILKIRKERDIEEYEITVVPGGSVFYRPPHAKKIDAIKGPETIASRELIGYPAIIRIVAGMKDNRLLQYVEYELATRYIINSLGDEKMQFILTLKRIYPGVDQNSRNSKGIYMFSRLRSREEAEPEEAAV